MLKHLKEAAAYFRNVAQIQKFNQEIEVDPKLKAQYLSVYMRIMEGVKILEGDLNE